MKKLIFAAALASTATFSATASADCGAVTITEMDWASSAVVTHVAKFLMEQGYGCNVTTVPSSTTPAMASLVETGQPDIVTELWTIYTPAYKGLLEEGKVVELSKVLTDGGVEAWWIPKYLADEHPELTTLEGIMANPELVGGRFHNCPAGWGCDVVNSNNLTASGLLEAGIENFTHGSGETLAASISAAYQAQEPWFGYYWTPTDLLASNPMVRVDVGSYNEAAHSCNVNQDCANPQLSAYPTADVVTTATTDFVEREPEVADLMRNVAFTTDQVHAVLDWQAANSASYEEAAVFFLATYKDVWGSWLNDEARSNLSALLN